MQDRPTSKYGAPAIQFVAYLRDYLPVGLAKGLIQGALSGAARRRGALAALALVTSACVSQQAAAAPSTSTTTSTSTTGTTGNLPAASAIFPANIYPLSTPPVGNGTNAACPSMEGVQTGVAAPSASALIDILNSFNSANSAEQAKLLSDRAAWSYIAPSASSQGSIPTISGDQTYLVAPGTLSSAPQPITAGCTPAVMSASWFLEICTQGGPFATCAQDHPALVGTAGFVDRNGHWLIWYLN